METSRRMVGHLGEVGTLTLRDGFPAHGELPRHSKSQWRLREAWQRNAEESLYALLHAWAKVAYPIELIGNDEDEKGWSPGPIAMAWPDSTVTPARAMIARLRDQWGIGSILTVLFSRWSFPGQHFGIIDLRQFDLSGANLRGADLSEANLIEANLRGANLYGAALPSANLNWANLNEAGLREAKLNQANLYGADLSEADCSGTYMGAARLHSADLSGAVNLTQEQIDRAFGNSQTKLPEGLERPTHWKDDD